MQSTSRRAPNEAAKGGLPTVNVKQAANVLELIEFFAAHRRPATLADIARHFDWPRSSTFNLLGTLIARGYLYEPRARDGYYPTPLWAVLVGQIEEAQPIPPELHRMLEQLVRDTGETAVLAAVSGMQALFVDAVESPSAVRYAARPGKRIPLHVTATGRALLSQMPLDDRTAILRKAVFEPYTATTLMSPEAVEDAIARSSELGWFEGNAEFTPDLGGVALPLGLPHRQFAVLVAGPMFRVHGRAEALVEIVRRACGDYLAEWRERDTLAGS
jgi:DNA-binding IclR family transcriptional regulator